MVNDQIRKLRKPWNKLCVYLIGTYVIIRKGKKENLHLKAVTMIYTVTGFKKNTILRQKMNINSKIS